jgi:hypothetical protein
MQTGQGTPQTVVQPEVIAFFLVTHSSFGAIRNKLIVVTHSNTEAEYRTLVDSTTDLL